MRKLDLFNGISVARFGAGVRIAISQSSGERMFFDAPRETAEQLRADIDAALADDRQAGAGDA